MKKTFILALGLLCLPIWGLQAAEKENSLKERYYGKITTINHNQRNLTVHNKKRNTDAEFQWNEDTKLVMNKKPIQAADLKVGQFLYVAYVKDQNKNKATTISVRTPFKKSSADN